jgi:Zn-dependent protease with chaperone function
VRKEWLICEKGSARRDNQAGVSGIIHVRIAIQNRKPTIINKEVHVEYRVHPNENLFFGVKVVSTIIVVGLIVYLFSVSAKAIAALSVFAVYAGMIALFFLIRKGLLIGYLRGSCVRVSQVQFPDIYKVIEEHSGKLGLPKAPALYILQSGGVLNAFATRFIGRDYIVLLSEVLESAYTEGPDAVSFIIGHELGHVKRRHMTWNFWLLPSVFVPFLQPAYSRACEYTCDSIGHFLCPAGSRPGMLILSVGKGLYKKVNVQDYLDDCSRQGGFWVWFTEAVSSHPFCPKRIRQFTQPNINP